MNNEYVAVKKQTLRDLIGFVENLYDCIDFESEEVKEHGVENGWDTFIQPICDIVNGRKNENDIGDEILAKVVDIKLFKEQLSNIYDYDVSELTNKQLTELYDTLHDRLANDDIYNDIYNNEVHCIASEEGLSEVAFLEDKINEAEVARESQSQQQNQEKNDKFVNKQLDL